MDLIDWPGVARNALWILGLSVALAAWSYVSWAASQRRVRLRNALNWAAFQAPFSTGLLLFAVSLAWGATRAWERIVWIGLALGFAWQVADAWRGAMRHGWQDGGRQAHKEKKT